MERGVTVRFSPVDAFARPSADGPDAPRHTRPHRRGRGEFVPRRYDAEIVGFRVRVEQVVPLVLAGWMLIHPALRPAFLRALGHPVPLVYLAFVAWNVVTTLVFSPSLTWSASILIWLVIDLLLLVSMMALAGEPSWPAGSGGYRWRPGRSWGSPSTSSPTSHAARSPSVPTSTTSTRSTSPASPRSRPTSTPRSSSSGPCSRSRAAELGAGRSRHRRLGPPRSRGISDAHGRLQSRARSRRVRAVHRVLAALQLAGTRAAYRACARARRDARGHLRHRCAHSAAPSPRTARCPRRRARRHPSLRPRRRPRRHQPRPANPTPPTPSSRTRSVTSTSRAARSASASRSPVSPRRR